MRNKKWSREETIIAFNVYCKVPFKQSSKSNPIIIKYARILGRSPSALNMKIGNLGRLDPALKEQGIVGLSNGSKMEEIVWNEFHGNWEKLAYESELLVAQLQNKDISDSIELNHFNRVGLDKDAVVKKRVNQNFFRSTILSSYNCKCCITNLSIATFLVASHIKPWALDKENRLNPKNGLCLNSIHDRAFDKGYLTIDVNFRVKISPLLYEKKLSEEVSTFFLQYDGRLINMPDRFHPNREFLDFHANEIFLG